MQSLAYTYNSGVCMYACQYANCQVLFELLYLEQMSN